jgi:CheY-like chemotaxis protein
MSHADRPRILLVEDDPDDVLLVQRALRMASPGFPLEVAGDGDAAIAYLDARRQAGGRPGPLPCLVLLDVKLPRRSGHEVLEWIRSQPGLRRLPVIALTSSNQQRDIDRAYDLGVNSYLVKPVRLHDAIEMLRQLLTYWTELNRAPDVREEPVRQPAGDSRPGTSPGPPRPD